MRFRDCPKRRGRPFAKMEKCDSIGGMKRKRATPVYKPYSMGQILLLPTDLEELIPTDHIVRTINEFVNQLDISAIEVQYKGGGTSSYHPRMMLKVLLYAYQQRIFSSRRIAKALREDVVFMWLSGLNQPDFRTINRFRGQILREEIETIFIGMLRMLVTMGYIKLEDYFVDGTKMEANANRYRVVWAKNVKRYQQQLEEKVKALFDEIERVNQEENRRYGERDLEELGGEVERKAEVLQEEVVALNTQLKEKRLNLQEEGQTIEERKDEGIAGEDEIFSVMLEGKDAEGETEGEKKGTLLSEQIRQKIAELRGGGEEMKKPVKRALSQLEKKYLPRAERYEDQLQKLDGRSSYAKSDVDATFMQMKNDKGRQPQLRPAYNVQLGTEKQYVVWWSIHDEAGDRECFVKHLSKLEEKLGRLPEKIVGDSAYGSEENYAYLENKGLGNYLKYPSFNRQQKKRYRKDPFRSENMVYEKERNEFICPQGKKMVFHQVNWTKTKGGYPVESTVYYAEDCQGCPVKTQCTKGDGNRSLSVQWKLWHYREQARHNLLSAEGKRLRSQRGVDVEPVYARFKWCWGFRRFHLRGREKVGIEVGLLSMAHNLSKVHQEKVQKQNKLGQPIGIAA